MKYRSGETVMCQRRLCPGKRCTVLGSDVADGKVGVGMQRGKGKLCSSLSILL